MLITACLRIWHARIRVRTRVLWRCGLLFPGRSKVYGSKTCKVIGFLAVCWTHNYSCRLLRGAGNVFLSFVIVNFFQSLSSPETASALLIIPIPSNRGFVSQIIYQDSKPRNVAIKTLSCSLRQTFAARKCDISPRAPVTPSKQKSKNVLLTWSSKISPDGFLTRGPMCWFQASRMRVSADALGTSRTGSSGSALVIPRF
jgi:hypothetical protein